MSELIKAEDAGAEVEPSVPLGRWRAGTGGRTRQIARRLRRSPSLIVAATALLLLAVVSLLAGHLHLADPLALTGRPLEPASSRHLLGTDGLGRDMLSRTVHGARTALMIAVGSSAIAVLIGAVLGGIAGYFGGWVDSILARLFDIALLIPSFFLLILIVSLFGSNMSSVLVVIGLTSWPRSARIMRSQVLAYRSRVFIDAARAAGCRHTSILFNHIVPNSIGPVVTDGSIVMGKAILVEAGLSYLGLSDSSVVSWGEMIHDGQSYLTIMPLISIIPGIAMLLTVMALTVVGDAISAMIREPGGSVTAVSQ